MGREEPEITPMHCSHTKRVEAIDDIPSHEEPATAPEDNVFRVTVAFHRLHEAIEVKARWGEVSRSGLQVAV